MKSLKGITNTMRVAIIGAVIVAIILIAGTFWTGKSASRDTESAVRNVSLLYLDELAGRREQVVASTLEDYISDLDVALGLMDADDLSSIKSLQAYQSRMKQLYSLEKFAFVDETGLIYTSRGTRSDIDQYNFDYTTISEPEISIKNEDSDNKKVIIAVPTDNLPFEGHRLLACFMEIDMDHMLDVLSLQSESNNTTFCNLYTAKGMSLTNMVLGGLASDNNLLDALENASFEDGYDIESMRTDFAQGNRGVVSFTYNDIRETMYYVGVHNTDWMLTYLIRESIISEQINTISEGIIQRSLIQSLLTAGVLIAVFTILIIQTRHASDLAIERETAEVMQQELEERLALQDELLEQEQVRAQQDSMITALASDYRSVYYVDLDTDDTICYRSDENDVSVSEGDHLRFKSTFISYAMQYVDENYRDGFIELINTENIRTALQKEPLIAYRYLMHKDGKDSYEMLRMARVSHPEDTSDGVIHAIGVGFTDIDVEMRESMSNNQALSDALDAAEEASKAKTVFLSNMSHEIRTPMNAIIGLDNLALHEPDISDKTKDYLEKIGSSAQHLLSLINDILDMSRIESGRMTIRNSEFLFSKLLEQINIIINGQCQDKGLEYNCSIRGQFNDYYIGDSTKLRQALINILGNAVKFTPKGGKVDFVIEKAASFDGKSTLKFIIKDTGIGMSKEYLPKLFEAFSQEDEGAANKYGSSGLGMAITKSIIEMMNGTIDVESKKDIGTTFTVVVTLMDSDKKEDDGTDVNIRPQELKVLIVDDDPVACDHARLVLENAGIASDIAVSGYEAIEAVKLQYARQQLYDLIVVDWNMPGIDGVETTKQIRSIIGDTSAIVILTAYNWDDIQEEAIDAGVDSFVAKPLVSDNLIEEFKAALKKRKALVKGKHNKADLNGRKVLLAEDMEINAQIMINVLEMKNIKADHAINGKVAVDMFASSDEGYYDAILMDMRMPEMDGLSATREIRKMNRSDAGNIPIIALTANAFDDDVQRSLQAGLNAHLAKPIDPETLFETLENLIPA